MVEKRVKLVVGEGELIALFEIVEGSEKLRRSIANGGESDNFSREELLGVTNGLLKISETDLVVAGFEIFHLSKSIGESLGRGDFFGALGLVVGRRKRKFLERGDGGLDGWFRRGLFGKALLKGVLLGDILLGSGAHSFNDFFGIWFRFRLGEEDDFGLEHLEMERRMEAETSLFDVEFGFDNIVKDIESARKVTAFDNETFERGRVAGDGKGLFAEITAAFDDDVKVVLGARSDANGGVGGGGVGFHLGFGGFFIGEVCVGGFEDGCADRDSGFCVGGAGGDDFGVREVDLAGLQESASRTGEFRGTDVPVRIAGGFKSRAESLVGGDAGAAADVDDWEINFTAADVTREADAVAGDNFAREVDSETIGDAEVWRDENAVRIGGEKADAVVDGKGGVGGHTDTDGAEDADGDAARAHGEDLALAGQGNFAATNVKNASAGIGFFGNDVITVEVNGDIVVN